MNSESSNQGSKKQKKNKVRLSPLTVSQISDCIQRCKDENNPVCRMFQDLIQGYGSYNKPYSDKSQSLYRNLRDSISRSEVENTGFMTLVNLLISTEPCEDLCDIAATVYNMLTQYRHDVFESCICDDIVSGGGTIIDRDFELRRYYPDFNKDYTPDIYAEYNGEKFIIEVKMRDPIYLDPKEFYEKYKISDDLNVIIVNYSSETIYMYGDCDKIPEFSIESHDTDFLNQLIIDTKKINNNYMRFELYKIIMKNEVDTEFKSFITGFEESCKELDSYKEIMEIYGGFGSSLIDAIDTFNISNKLTIDTLNNSSAIMYKHVITEILPSVKSKYDNMVQDCEYSRFPVCNIDVESSIDKYNEDLYEKTNKFSPSLYIPYNKSIKMSHKNRLDHYNDIFSSDINLTGMDDYTRSAITMIKNIFSSEDLSTLLGLNKISDLHTQLTMKSMNTASNLTTNKNKEYLKKSYELYDINIYINNTFSYTDNKIAHSKTNICGFHRKSSGNDPKKTYLSISENKSKIGMVEELISNWDSYYDNVSIMEDLKTFTESFDVPIDIDETLLDYNSYYSYTVSNLFKSMIALSNISTKKYRLLQTTDPNTICVLLPNGDCTNGKPIRYFSVTVCDDMDVVNLNKVMGIYHSHVRSNNRIIILSKVISLDLNRSKLLATSFTKYLMMCAYHDGFHGYMSNKKIVNFNNLLYTNMITLETLSVTENFKNIIMVCYSDYGNPNKLILDKFHPRIKNYTMLSLTCKMVNAMYDSANQRRKILKSQNEAELSEDGFDLKNTGFRSVSDLKLPISGLRTFDPKEVLQEAYLMFYLGNKTLHGSPQELINLYYIPIEFEKEYNSYLKENNTVIQELTNDSEYGFSYNTMKNSIILAYSNQMGKIDIMRKKIAEDLGLERNLISTPQFSSTKSMVTNVTRKLHNDPLRDDFTVEQFSNWLLTVEINDIHDFLKYVNKEIEKCNVVRKERLNERKISKDKDDIDSHSPDSTLFPNIQVEYKNNGAYIITTTPFTTVRFGMNDKINCDSNKVFDEILTNDKMKGDYTFRSAYLDLLQDKQENVFRVFNKDQRTYNDREIYTGNMTARLCLYPIERLFLTHNNNIEEEAITISGDYKHKKMSDQRREIIKDSRYKYNKNIHKKELISISSDASKWSARDSYVKFIMVIAYNPYLTRDEKWFYIYMLCRYYKKSIVLTDNVLKSLFQLAKQDKPGTFEELTDDFNKNYFVVRSNWLQGNLNRLSSFVHYCSSITIKSTIDALNNRYGDSTCMNFMVHSDDSTYDFMMLTDTTNKQDIDMRLDTGRYLMSILSTVEKRHSITVNTKKTYMSTFYKEFLSTLLVGNVLSYFYMADLLPIASDLSYKSPLDDMASLSSFINNSFAHCAPMRVIKIAINLINYTTLSTYNQNNTSNKSCYDYFYKNERCNFAMVPISLLPIYRFDVNMAGIIPYYCADAFYILDNLLALVGSIDLSLSLEDAINQDVCDKYLESCSYLYKNYIKLTLMTFDSTVFLDDNEDPYDLTTKDLAIKPLVSVAPIIKRGKTTRYKSYVEFKQREDEILKKYISHPEWILSKPKDFPDCRDCVLANYLMPNFIDSLKFSTSARDYGKRIIDSNKKLYKLNYKGIVSKENYKITDVYKKIVDDVTQKEVNGKLLNDYLHTMLFSDKELAYAIQIYYTKKAKDSIPKFLQTLKPTMPQSLFKRDRGKYSVTAIINNLLIDSGKLLDFDLKTESILDYSYSLLKSINISEIKIYNGNNSDQELVNYCLFNNLDHRDPYVLTELDVFDDEDTRLKVVECRRIFKSILIRYFNDMLLFRINKDHKFLDVPTPQSIITTIDKYSKKDSIGNKVYMSFKRNSRKDEYWLSRLGMYQDEHQFTVYKVSDKYIINNKDELILRENKDEIVNSFMRVNHIFNKHDINITDYNINIDGMTTADYVNRISKSTKLSHKLMSNRIGITNNVHLLDSLKGDHRVMNFWPIPHDGDNSLVIYLYKGTFLKVQTNPGKYVNEVNVDVKFYNNGYPDRQVISRLISQFNRDYRTKLINKEITTSVRKRFNKNIIYKDNNGVYTTHGNDRFGNDYQRFLEYDVIRYDNIQNISTDIDKNYRYVYSFEVCNGNIKLFDYMYRDTIFINYPEMSRIFYNICLDYKEMISIVLAENLINEDNCVNYLSIMDYDQILSYTIMSKKTGNKL